MDPGLFYGKVNFCYIGFSMEKKVKTLNFSGSFVACDLKVVGTCDSSSLTNEKDHHYFLNSADVCW